MAFKMTGPWLKSALKHSTEKVLGKEQPVGPHSHPGERVVAQGADVDDLESDLEYENQKNAVKYESQGDVNRLLKDLETVSPAKNKK